VLKKMPRSFVLAFGGLLVTAFLAGCASGGNSAKTSSPGLLEPQPIVRFSDVPLPAGFKLLPEQSYSFEASGVRVGMLKYQGTANPDLVVNFYKEQMAMYNWRLLNIVEYGERLMNFDRDDETCIVNIAPKGRNLSITVSIGPKSRYLNTGTQTKAERPLK
jgi:hypothetical protein